VDARTDTVLLDDYVLPVEPVADYLTRFSGLVPEDLNPNTSRHHLVSPKTALLKLKYFIDRGCVFVGHGLEKDFHTCNVFVSPENVRDTVELWHLPGRRKISLRFLASFVLKHDIQVSRLAFYLVFVFERCFAGRARNADDVCWLLARFGTGRGA